MDIIQLLPDSIANQIAAGEVIQRPASAVKELLENAVDAGATEIKLIVQDAGKALIQVIDNGKGMSETDARLSFERHATSKIQKIDDLFHIKTMGFRGEALASIAAVAQVELKTRRAEDELGTYIEIENSIVIKQEPCAAPFGTSISMKNLFFNVPARRNFLKSNAAELRHIIEEFIRVAMAFPHLFFSLTSNGQEVFHLEAGSLKQRVVQALGNHLNAQLVALKDETDYINISGFIGKPEVSRKTRGDQYIFVNNRFIKSSYLNHAIVGAFIELIPKENFPLYVLFLEIDPAQVDINVHPTKQEIKFEDEKIIYAFVKAAVKHALAQASIAPSLDFSLNADIQQLDAINKPFNKEEQESAATSNLFKTFTQRNQAHFIESDNKAELQHWQDFYTPSKENSSSKKIDAFLQNEKHEDDFAFAQYDFLSSEKAKQEKKIIEGAPLLQVLQTYILAPAENGFVLIHQQLAHERILYERFEQTVHRHSAISQQLLMPSALQLSVADKTLLEELLPDLKLIGYIIEKSADNIFSVTAVPADLLNGNETKAIELLLEQYKHFNSEVKFSKREKIVRCLARQHAVKAGRILTEKEMRQLVEDLFQCQTSNLSPSGSSPTFIEFKENYLDGLFGI
ncbi:DNA mismatch repair protein MutL [Arachidicoccus ginsenosidimutans]|uniref:DNA mismatch repair endonuclease MutL n=1 Tax=Arachidicoccus sp. BS20 TaxID=1850526 RepID=UPI0007F0F16F|nr:DNA mismatch repair endonuclease MutL [Arachidicoccus sp. BS20]ANI90318.1 DNA mismatch repair protein MutL [Arachidicoccus sp. BS20]